jgi:DNA-binding transcriptional MocR family regulator
MQSWLPDLGANATPKYLAIVDAIEEGVRTGSLRPGERLPPQRALARTLGIDLTTVTRAYGLARDAGLIEGAGKLGSFVCNSAGHVAGAAAETSGMILPPQPGFGLLGEAMRQGLGRLLRAGGSSPLLQYQPPGGAAQDRLQAAQALTARGIPTEAEQVVLASGGQNALHAIAATVLRAGDGVCVGRSVYPGMLALARRLGLRLILAGGDAGGFDARAVADAVRAGARALYIVPTNDNPTTMTLGLEQRRALADMARAHGLWVLEDDAYGQLPAAPLPPIAVFAPDRTWHIASLSKIVSPVLRVAHVRAPGAGAAADLAMAVQDTAVMAPPLNAALVTTWLREGIFADLVAAVRDEGVARQRIAARHLRALDHQAHPEGYHIWLRTGAGSDPVALATRLRPTGLSIVPGTAFASDPVHADRAVRISIGGAIDHVRLDRALARLRSLLSD